jgi:hypothetical protein
METGAVGVRVQDLRALVELYDLAAEERDLLYALVRQARHRGWWHEYADVYPPGSATLYGLEDAAARIRVHSPTLVPGLLQTERYARALIGSAPTDPIIVDRRVALRVRRQQLLDRSDPPIFVTVIDEAVLHHMIGGPEVMTEQVTALLQAADRPHIQIHVLEFDAGAYPAAGVPFSVFEYGIPGVAPVAYQEQLLGNTYIDEAHEVEGFEAAWRAVLDTASNKERSREVLASRLSKLR